MSEGPARVLELLRDATGAPGPVLSGETLSRELGVSRAQVWKHVEALRRRGYDIAGAPGGGYRLSALPDRLYPEEVHAGLRTRWLGRPLLWHEEIDSTNREALELARAGATAGTAVVAEAQSAGRGRLGRSFFSPPARNLYTSLVLRPELSLAEAPGLILASAVAVAEAVAAALPAGRGDEVDIKWPNDVRIAGLKTSGILVELDAEATRVAAAVLGIGVNLNVARDELPEEFRHRATSLAEASGRPVPRAAFARDLYERLEEVLEAFADGGFDRVRPRFEARFHMRGERVRVEPSVRGGPSLEGVVRGIGADGSLEVETEESGVVPVLAGDVTLAKEETRS